MATSRQVYSQAEKDDLLIESSKMFKINRTVWGKSYWENLVRQDSYKGGRTWQSAKNCMRNISLHEPEKFFKAHPGASEYGKNTAKKPRKPEPSQKFTKEESRLILKGMLKNEDQRSDLTSETYWQQVLAESGITRVNWHEVKNHFFKQLADSVTTFLDPSDSIRFANMLIDAYYISHESNTEDEDEHEKALAVGGSCEVIEIKVSGEVTDTKQNTDTIAGATMPLLTSAYANLISESETVVTTPKQLDSSAVVLLESNSQVEDNSLLQRSIKHQLQKVTEGHPFYGVKRRKIEMSQSADVIEPERNTIPTKHVPKSSQQEEGSVEEPIIEKVPVLVDKEKIIVIGRNLASTYRDLCENSNQNEKIGSLKTYYEQCVRGIGESLLRRFHEAGNIKARPPEISDIEYVHTLTAETLGEVKQTNVITEERSLSRAVARISVMARDQLRLLKIVEDCETCREKKYKKQK